VLRRLEATQELGQVKARRPGPTVLSEPWISMTPAVACRTCPAPAGDDDESRTDDSGFSLRSRCGDGGIYPKQDPKPHPRSGCELCLTPEGEDPLRREVAQRLREPGVRSSFVFDPCSRQDCAFSFRVRLFGARRREKR